MIKLMKNDPFSRLTIPVQDADCEESAEILSEIEKLQDDDLIIVASKRFSIEYGGQTGGSH